MDLALAHNAPCIPWCTCLLCRDIPVSWFAARENAFNDPGHETVLHHGAGPFLERGKAQPRTVKRTAMDVNGYTIRYGWCQYAEPAACRSNVALGPSCMHLNHCLAFSCLLSVLCRLLGLNC